MHLHSAHAVDHRISWGSHGVSVFPSAATGQDVQERCLLLPTTTSVVWESRTTPRWQVQSQSKV